MNWKENRYNRYTRSYKEGKDFGEGSSMSKKDSIEAWRNLQSHGKEPRVGLEAWNKLRKADDNSHENEFPKASINNYRNFNYQNNYENRYKYKNKFEERDYRGYYRMSSENNTLRSYKQFNQSNIYPRDKILHDTLRNRNNINNNTQDFKSSERHSKSNIILEQNNSQLSNQQLSSSVDDRYYHQSLTYSKENKLGSLPEKNDMTNTNKSDIYFNKTKDQSKYPETKLNRSNYDNSRLLNIFGKNYDSNEYVPAKIRALLTSPIDTIPKMTLFFKFLSKSKPTLALNYLIGHLEEMGLIFKHSDLNLFSQLLYIFNLSNLMNGPYNDGKSIQFMNALRANGSFIMIFLKYFQIIVSSDEIFWHFLYFYLHLCYLNENSILLIKVSALEEKLSNLRTPIDEVINAEINLILSDLRHLETAYLSEVYRHDINHKDFIPIKPMLDSNLEEEKENLKFMNFRKNNSGNIETLLDDTRTLPFLPQNLCDIQFGNSIVYDPKLNYEYNVNNYYVTTNNYLEDLKLQYKAYIWHKLCSSCVNFFNNFKENDRKVGLKSPGIHYPTLKFKKTISHIGNTIPTYDIIVFKNQRNTIINKTLVVLFSLEDIMGYKSKFFNNEEGLINFENGIIIGTIYYNTKQKVVNNVTQFDVNIEIPMKIYIESDPGNKLDLFKKYYMVITNINQNHSKVIGNGTYFVNETYLANSPGLISNNLAYEINSINSMPSYLSGECISLDSLLSNNNILQGLYSLEDLPNYKNFTSHNDVKVNESQFKAIKFMLCNKVSLTVGSSKTGKLKTAIDVARIITGSLKELQYPDPIIIITNSTRKLYTLIEQISEYIPDVVYIDTDFSEAPQTIKSFNIDLKINHNWNNKEKNKWEEIQYKKEMLLWDWNRILRISENLKNFQFIVSSFVLFIPDNLKDNFLRYEVNGSNFNRNTSLMYVILRWLGASHVFGSCNPMKCLSEVFNAEEISSEVHKHIWSQVDSNPWNMAVDKRRDLMDKFGSILLKFTQFQYNEIGEGLKEIYFEVEELKIGLWVKVLNNVPVIALTAESAIENYFMLHKLNGRIAIVLESEKLDDADLLTIVTSLSLGHLILFGNPSQLDSFPYTANIQTKIGWKNIFIRETFNQKLKVCKLSNCYIENRGLAPIMTALCPDTQVIFNKMDTLIPNGLKYPLSFVNIFFNKSSPLFNRVESKFIAQFIVYLYQQGYAQEDIAIFAITSAQIDLILENLRYINDSAPWNQSNYPKGTNFSPSVFSPGDDVGGNFKIVILSLVFSNVKYVQELAYLKFVYNCLFSSTQGAYIFGNYNFFNKLESWKPFLNLFIENGLVKPYLELQCRKHKTIHQINSHKDFNELCQFGGCKEKCDQRLKCGHACELLCHPWPHSDFGCHKPCSRPRPKNCTHYCKKECFECKNAPCPPCLEEVEAILPCQHILKIQCFEQNKVHDIKCSALTTVKLSPCRHDFITDCFRTLDNDYLSSVKCKEIVEKLLNCGHTSKGCCYEEFVCQELCSEKMECGHSCMNKCGVEHSHSRDYCQHECSKILLCGHSCQRGCALPSVHTKYCNQECSLYCPHKIFCPKLCYEQCVECAERCLYECVHQKCNKLCSDFCDRPPCQERCQSILECNHQCPGFCGEPCSPCVKCNILECPIALCQISDIDIDKKDLVYMLPDCNCVFLASSLDTYFQSNHIIDNDLAPIQIWSCPKCQKNILTAPRYEKYTKKGLLDYAETKSIMIQDLNTLTNEEQKQVVSAMAETVDLTVYDMVGGRWFKCPNGHPYYIGDCGGATELSYCPECMEVIGGTDHRIIPSNRFFGEFDQSEKPAWPGQH